VRQYIQEASKLKQEGYSVEFFVFDSFADVFLIESIRDNHVVHTWNPVEMSLNDYLSRMRECTLMVTSRAHGAIISACLGIPSICIAIEDKLATVAYMLSRSSLLVEPSLRAASIAEIIKERITIPNLSELARREALENHMKMKDGIQTFKQFVQR
jgi:polysaccharide pyruvyl transferase WcaK-like protein